MRLKIGVKLTDVREMAKAITGGEWCVEHGSRIYDERARELVHAYERCTDGEHDADPILTARVQYERLVDVAAACGTELSRHLMTAIDMAREMYATAIVREWLDVDAPAPIRLDESEPAPAAPSPVGARANGDKGESLTLGDGTKLTPAPGWSARITEEPC